jgi:phosphohistidine phosphatase
MRTLLLLRHGKSDWDSDVADHERPLTRRGKRDALRLGAALGLRGLLPDTIVSSTARRARSTARRVAEALPEPRQVSLEPNLYATSGAAYLSVAAALPDSAGTALLVGHNPLLEEAVLLLSGRALSLPTASLVCVDLPIDSWRELSQRTDGVVRLVLLASQLPAVGGEP